MNVQEVEKDPELQQILWACYIFWQTETEVPLEERSICYSWVIKTYKERFIIGFNRSKLQKLAELGFLSKDDTSRGGNRRYYKIVDPDWLASFLKKKGLL